MKNKNIFKINLIYFIAITLVAIIFVLGYMGILQNEFLTSFLIQIVTMFAIPLLLYSLFCKKNLKEAFSDTGFKRITFKMVLISIVLGAILYFINSFVADAFYSFISMFGYETLPSQATQTTINYGTLLKELVLSCILPGFCEEFLHRGIMLHAKRKHVNTRYCLLISSILFGLVHLNIRQFFYAAILGFLMGYTSLVADSIYPSIIIHFMNNFLSNYFYYGSHFKWPLASFISRIRELLFSDMFIFVTSTTIGVILLFMLYMYLLKKLKQERIQKEIRTIIKSLEIQNLPLPEAQLRFEHVNQLLQNKAVNQEKKTSTFTEKIFLISSIVLGALITFSSFLWGVI